MDSNTVAFLHLAQKVLLIEIGDMMRDNAGFTARSSQKELVYETGVLKNFANSQESACARVSFLMKLQVSSQVFSCEFCKYFKNTFFTEQPWTTVSALRSRSNHCVKSVQIPSFFWSVFSCIRT